MKSRNVFFMFAVWCLGSARRVPKVGKRGRSGGEHGNTFEKHKKFNTKINVLKMLAAKGVDPY